MNRLSFILAAAFVASATAASAEPVLRSDVTVTSPIVTIGDMFEEAGELAGKPLFRAPAPGTWGTVSLDAVQHAARLAGLYAYDSTGVFSVRVARAGTIVDAAMLGELVVADLAVRGAVPTGATAAPRFDALDIAFTAAAVDTPARLTALSYAPATHTFVARFLIAGRETPVELTGRVEMMVEAPHLVATRPAGAVLAPADIEMRAVPLSQVAAGGAASLEQLVGKQLLRQSHAGLMLRAADVTEPQVIARNDVVTVVLSAGPMTLTVKGQALNAAAPGEPVQVLNAVSRKILQGVAQSPGIVTITNTINVAGL